MSLEEKQKKRKYRTLFIFVTLLLFILGFIYLDEVTKRKNEAKQKTDQVSIERYNELESRLVILEKIKQIDQQLLFSSNYEATLSELQLLKSEVSEDADLTASIDNRINYLENLIEEQNEDELSKINLRNQILSQDKLIDSLYKKQDSLSLSYNKINLQNTRKIDSLKLVLKKKDHLLNQKESVKVLTFKNDNGNLIRYLGETKNEMANGNGVGIWNTSSIYRGEWKDNKRHGIGEFEWSDGQKYEGEFVEGIRSGEGVYYWPSGEKYVGEFKNNKRNGEGTFYDPDGNIKFEGKWKNDKLVTN